MKYWHFEFTVSSKHENISDNSAKELFEDLEMIARTRGFRLSGGYVQSNTSSRLKIQKVGYDKDSSNPQK